MTLKKKFHSWDCTRPFNNAKFIGKIDYAGRLLRGIDSTGVVSVRCLEHSEWNEAYIYSNIHETRRQLCEDCRIINRIDHYIHTIMDRVDQATNIAWNQSFNMQQSLDFHHEEILDEISHIRYLLTRIQGQEMIPIVRAHTHKILVGIFMNGCEDKILENSGGKLICVPEIFTTPLKILAKYDL